MKTLIKVIINRIWLLLTVTTRCAWCKDTIRKAVFHKSYSDGICICCHQKVLNPKDLM